MDGRNKIPRRKRASVASGGLVVASLHVKSSAGGRGTRTITNVNTKLGMQSTGAPISYEAQRDGDEGDSRIVTFFRDQVVFLTGVTGFLGKVLLWQLYRVCKARKIYVLVRTRKQKKSEATGQFVEDQQSSPQELIQQQLLERFEQEVLNSPILQSVAQEERFKSTVQVPNHHLPNNA